MSKLMTVPELLDADEVVRRFLRVTPRRRSVNRLMSSYGWKHVVERWAEVVYGRHVYISEGAFTDIAREEGVICKPVGGRSPNSYCSLVIVDFPR